ncbi:MAG TPA: Ig-like domain-containing protein, partial [Azonexus sp.]|nr:Ig-like domain-containing protein [Azonexus sp.]
MSTTNTKPTVENDSYFVNEDDVLKVNNGQSALSNDSDDQNDKLSAVLVSPPSNSLFKFNANGTFVFDASNYDYLAAGATVTDSFTYRAYDGQLYSDPATVTITITGVNDAPVAVGDGAITSASSSTLIDALANDSDVDTYPVPDTLTITALTDLGDASAAINAGPDGSDVDASDGLSIKTGGGSVSLVGSQLQYIPDANFFGVDTFQYTVSDGHGGTATAVVSVTVTPTNQMPNAVDDTYTVAEDATLTQVAPGVLDNDTDPDSDLLGSQLATGLVNVTNASGDTGVLTDFNSDGSFSYDTNGGFQYLGVGQSEDITFTYDALDGTGLSDTATVTITVTGTNDGPTARDDRYNA